ncbi:hypothetical protein DRJ17_03715 [Candidatus Woesearchaeota archaeon]|nr:MAG: hypothetical protein DRJ17_03715 [Candidatus Woesearchaeota archaeon]
MEDMSLREAIAEAYNTIKPKITKEQIAGVIVFMVLAAMFSTVGSAVYKGVIPNVLMDLLVLVVGITVLIFIAYLL